MVKKRKTRVKVNWTKARDFFISMNVESDNRACTFKTVAEHFGCSYGAVRNQAAKGEWENMLILEREKRTKAVQEAITEAHNKSLEKLNGEAINAETEVRRRQATVARMMYSQGASRLRTIKPEELTPAEATTLVRVGLQEERRALGIPDEVHITGGDNENTREVRPEDIHSIFDNILEMVQDADGTFKSETETD